MKELSTVSTYREPFAKGIGMSQTIVAPYPSERQVPPSLPLLRVIAQEQGNGTWYLEMESRSQRGRMHEVLVSADGCVRCDCLAAVHQRPCWHQRDAQWLVDQAAAVLAEYAAIKASRQSYDADGERGYRASCRTRLEHIAWRIRQRGYQLARIADWTGVTA